MSQTEPASQNAQRLVLLVGTFGILAGVVGIRLAQDVQWVRFFDNMHWTVGTATAAIFAWLGQRSAVARNARGLRWIAIGLTAYAVGQVIWDAQTFLGYSDFPSPSDLFYLWLGPCVGAGLLIEVFQMSDRAQRKTLLMDAAMLAIAAVTLVLALYLPRRGGMDLLPLAILVAYPVTLFSALSIGLIAIPTLRLRLSWSYGLFLVSLATTAVCWMVWNAMALDGKTIDGSWFNSLFSLSVFGMGLATLNWSLSPSRDVQWERWSEGFLRLLPMAAVVLACVAVIVLDEALPKPVNSVIEIGAIVVVCLAVFRQSALLHEHDMLKAVSSKLEASEQQRILILNALPDLIWLKDAEGTFLMCNPVFERMYGHPESEILGKTDFDFVELELAQFFRQKDQEAMLAGRPCRNEEWVTFAMMVTGR